jgi:hypothetical protein
MTGRIYWIEKPHILSVDYSDEVTVADVKAAAQNSLVALHHHAVYFLVDLSQSQSVSPDAIQLPSFTEWIQHPNARWFAYVQASGLMKSLLQMRQGGTAKFFSDRESALAFLYTALNYTAKT